MGIDILFTGIIGFEWDRDNIDKNYIKHNVKWYESEEVFFNAPAIIKDEKHSAKEKRYYLLGETGSGRRLFVVFTIRRDRIRVISARDMHRKERRIYEERRQEKDTEIQE